MKNSNPVLDLVETYSTREQLLNSIESFLQSRTGSPFKNMDASYLIVAILMNSNFEHYGAETLLQDALTEYKKIQNENK